MKKITVLIPCYHKHINLLFRTINSFIKGTKKPYQMLISLNGCKYISNNKFEQLQKYSNYFKHFDILKSENVLNRSLARNIAYDYIKGDVISLCDADDIQHPQRIEIVEYFFNNYDIVHLLNSYILSGCLKNNNNNHCFLCKNNYKRKFDKYSMKDIKFMDTKEVYKLNYFNDNIQPGVKTVLAFNDKNQILVGHGSCHFTKEVLSEIKFNENYPRGQDSLFCQEVLKKFKKTMVIDADLTIYYNGWVPQKNQFYKFNYKNDNLYLNTGSANPPSPGKPRPSYEYKFIQKSLDNMS